MATAKKAVKSAKKAPAKKAAKKAAARKAAPRRAAGAASKSSAPARTRAPNAAFMKEMTPSPQLAAVIGAEPKPRTEITKRVWDYIKANKLQDQNNKRMINADAKLLEIFEAPQVSMFEMTKLINGHLK